MCIYRITALSDFAAIALFVASTGHAQSSRNETEMDVREYLTAHPEEVQRIVMDFLLKNPEVLQAVLVELIKRRLPNVAGYIIGFEATRRLREAQFVAVVTPSVKHILTELAGLGRQIIRGL